jgi:transcription-repair coupling factor (superfamily II helicase)
MRIRLLMKSLLIKEAEFDGSRLVLTFHPKTPVSPDTIVRLIRSDPGKCAFTPDYRLVSEIRNTSFEGVLAGTRNLLIRLV